MEFERTSKQSKSEWKNFKGSPSDVQDTPYIVYTSLAVKGVSERVIITAE